MINACEATDFLYPMKADIYFPILTQGEYGQPQKDWVYDRTIICNATPVGGLGTEDIKPEAFLQYENKLIVRTKNDPRVSSNNVNNATTNILVTNIRNAQDLTIYKETAGPRSGRGTIYEIATVEPFTGPFGDIEYYKMLWRRTENQTVGD
jgi:hypothetical protein